jgi:spore germination protein YaaH
MPIPLFLLDRVRTSALSGEQVADAFAKLARVADKAGIAGCAINLQYVADDDRLLFGDLIPTITLSLTRQTEAVGPVPAEVIDVESQP